MPGAGGRISDAAPLEVVSRSDDWYINKHRIQSRAPIGQEKT